MEKTIMRKPEITPVSPQVLLSMPSRIQTRLFGYLLFCQVPLSCD